MADSDTTQQVTSKTPASGKAIAERTRHREDHERVLAEARALIANSRLKRAETLAARREDHERELAEVRDMIANSRLKRAETPEARREDHERELAEARDMIANSRLKRAETTAIADAPSAKNVLTTWLRVISIVGLGSAMVLLSNPH